MCELLGLSASHPVTVNLSLERLAEHGGVAGPSRDGWGVAYYEGRDTRLIKDIGPAAGSPWLKLLDGLELRSSIVLAHIRRTTIGARTYSNNQPFCRELGGRMHIFAHNGHMPGLLQSRGFSTRRFRPMGETDSEIAFCALLDQLAACWKDAEPPPLDDRFAIVAAFAERLRVFGPANFLYSDGNALFAHGHRRFNPLSQKIDPPGLTTITQVCIDDQPGMTTEGLKIDNSASYVTLVASGNLE